MSGNGGEYHALLDQPIVRPTVTIDVPVSKGVTGSANGVAYGLVEDQWFFVDVIQRLVHQMHLDPAGCPSSCPTPRVHRLQAGSGELLRHGIPRNDQRQYRPRERSGEPADQHVHLGILGSPRALWGTAATSAA